MNHSFWRILRLAFKDFWRNIWLSLVTITVLVLAILSVNVLVSLGAITDSIVGSVEDKVDISVFFKPNVGQATIENFEQKVLTMNEVKQTLFVSKEQALDEFKEKHTLKIKVLKTEHIIQLKAITERKNDFDDIRTILKNDKNFDWQYLIDETIWQHRHGDSWAVLDIEKIIQELKKYIFIEEKYLGQLYKAQKKAKK